MLCYPLCVDLTMHCLHVLLLIWCQYLSVVLSVPTLWCAVSADICFVYCDAIICFVYCDACICFVYCDASISCWCGYCLIMSLDLFLPDIISGSREGTIVDGVNLDEIREFAKQFKIRRLSLGLTQTQVGQALSATEGPSYSQSAICRCLLQIFPYLFEIYFHFTRVSAMQF